MPMDEVEPGSTVVTTGLRCVPWETAWGASSMALAGRLTMAARSSARTQSMPLRRIRCASVNQPGDGIRAVMACSRVDAASASASSPGAAWEARAGVCPAFNGGCQRHRPDRKRGRESAQPGAIYAKRACGARWWWWQPRTNRLQPARRRSGRRCRYFRDQGLDVVLMMDS